MKPSELRKPRNQTNWFQPVSFGFKVQFEKTKVVGTIVGLKV